MRQHVIDIYKFEELSDEAKEKALYDWAINGHYPWHGENRAVLDFLTDELPIHVTSWEYGGPGSGVSWRPCLDNDEAMSLTGARLMAYVWNNHGHAIYEGKYYSKGKYIDGKYTHKSRHSKVLLTEACPTGYCVGSMVIQPMLDVVNGKHVNDNYTYEDMIQDCLNEWIAACESDLEYYYSEESLADMSEANEWEYTEDGSLF